MVFFFDEAHLLFKLKSKELMDKVEQVIRLIRSKGVGVFFITQNPADVPDSVLSQLGNKIQHALRAYTPADQKSVKAAARSFVVNPAFKTEEVIPNLGKGEALVSFLDEKGVPSMVQRKYILPPQSSFGVLDEEALRAIINTCDMGMKYNQTIEEFSAYEQIMALEAAAAAGSDAMGDDMVHQGGQTIMVNGQPQTISNTYIPADAQAAAAQPQPESQMNETEKLIAKLKAEKEAAALEMAEMEKEKAELEKEKAKLEKENAKLEKQKKKKSSRKSSTQRELEKAGITVAKNAASTLVRKWFK